MSTASHAAVGAIIAITLKQPVLVLPLAFISHFVLDALPHFGYSGQGYGEALKHRMTLVHQIFVGLEWIALIILLHPFGWLPYIAGAVAISPDLMWPIRYFFYERHDKPPKPNGSLVQFHKRVQWMERPWGSLFEVPFGILMLVIIYSLRP